MGNSCTDILTQTLERGGGALRNYQMLRHTGESWSSIVMTNVVTQLWRISNVSLSPCEEGGDLTYPRWQRMSHVNKEFCRGEELSGWHWKGGDLTVNAPFPFSSRIATITQATTAGDHLPQQAFLAPELSMLDCPNGTNSRWKASLFCLCTAARIKRVSDCTHTKEGKDTALLPFSSPPNLANTVAEVGKKCFYSLRSC